MVTLLARRGVFLTALILASLSLVAASASAAPTLDVSFGGGGITPKLFPDGKWPQNAGGAVQLADGEILVPMTFSSKYGHDGGVLIVGTLSFNDFDGTSAGIAYKFRADGSRDQTFGVGGRIRGPAQDVFTGITGLPGGDFLVLGVKYTPENTNPSNGPVGSTASVLDSRGGLTNRFAGATTSQTKRMHQTQIDRAATGNVVLYTRYGEKGVLGSRIVKFTN